MSLRRSENTQYSLKNYRTPIFILNNHKYLLIAIYQYFGALCLICLTLESFLYHFSDPGWQLLFQKNIPTPVETSDLITSFTTFLENIQHRQRNHQQPNKFTTQFDHSHTCQSIICSQQLQHTCLSFLYRRWILFNTS